MAHDPRGTPDFGRYLRCAFALFRILLFQPCLIRQGGDGRMAGIAQLHTGRFQIPADCAGGNTRYTGNFPRSVTLKVESPQPVNIYVVFHGLAYFT